MTLHRSSIVTIAVVVFVTYQATLRFNIVRWDDHLYVSENEAVLQPQGIITIWSRLSIPGFSTNWPVTNTTYWLEYRLWGPKPGLYHLTNVVLHAVCAGLAYVFLVQIGAGRPAAWIAALLFAVHPVQVESVAWISERKNMLSGIFFFWCLIEYVRYRRSFAYRRYALSLILFVLGLLSKTGVVVLPVVLLLTDRLVIDGQWRWRSAARAAPFFALAILGTLATMSADVLESHALPYWVRPLVAARAIWFYLGKLAYPANLVPLYPRWQLDPASLGLWLPAVVLVVALVGLVFCRRRMGNLVLWGLGLFIVNLLPVLGLQPFLFMRHSYVADHFLYLPCLGVFLIVGLVWERLAWRPKGRRFWFYAPAVVVVVVLATRSMTQTKLWKDNNTFWSFVFSASPAAGYDAVAEGFLRDHDLIGAKEYLPKVLRLRPGDAYATSSLGWSLYWTGETEQGLAYLHRAVTIDPTNFDAWYHLGSVFLAERDYERAAACLERSLQTNPPISQGILDLKKPLEPSADLAPFLSVRQEIPLRIDRPAFARAGFALGRALAGSGRLLESTGQFEEIVTAFPEHEDAWIELAKLTVKRGNAACPAVPLKARLGHHGNATGIRWALAWMSATTVDRACRDSELAWSVIDSIGTEALTPRRYDILAAVHAARGQFADARHYANKALRQNGPPLSRAIRQRLELYERNEPYRE